MQQAPLLYIANYQNLIADHHVHTFPQDVIYKINRRTRECTNSRPTSPFRRIEVPPNATFYGTFYVGSTSEPLAGFKVNSFGGDTDNGEYRKLENFEVCLTF